MFLEMMVEHAQLFLLIFVRIFAMLSTAPLVSSSSTPGIARIGLTLFAAVTVLPWLADEGGSIPQNGLAYLMLLFGEIMIGLIIGFFLTMFYSAFQIAGEFFSLQMGFGASQVYDPLAQIELPIMGQFLNLIAMYTFVVIGGFRDLFLKGIYGSFRAITALDLVMGRNEIFGLLINGFTGLFMQAIIIALPILGTLFLMSTAMGLLAKAAPQMNLLLLGFPINITVAFLMLFAAMPFMIDLFARVIDMSFEAILRVLDQIAGNGPFPMPNAGLNGGAQ